MDSRALICAGQSDAIDTRGAVRELRAALVQPDPALVMFFSSPAYDRDELAAEFAKQFEGVPVVGCTTAGEIGPAGCRNRSIVGVSFSSRGAVAASGCIDALSCFESESAVSLVQALLQRLEAIDARVSPTNTFAVLLIDGLSVREERVAAALQGALGEIPLVGGSAGDGLDFGSTHVYCDGAFGADRAAVMLVSTSLPFTTFKTQHFIKSEQRVVVTRADPERRVVNEIDGLPAAAEYAEVVGVDAESLDPHRFAAQPMVVVINGTDYVRSIQKVNADGSMTFFCAIEEGLVLRAARCGNLVEDLEQALAAVRGQIGEPLVVLSFDCILRKLEAVQAGLVDQVQTVLCANNVVGFNTYGEQYRGVHVNQTVTGIAIGAPLDD